MTDAPSLTPRQRDVLLALVRHRRLYGLRPTLDEVAEEVGCAKVTVYEHVAGLERGGYVRKLERFASRNVMVTQRGKRAARALEDGLARLRESWEAATEEERKAFRREVRL